MSDGSQVQLRAESSEAAKRILLAEDDDALRTLLAAVLRAAGYEVVHARDGAELLDRLVDEALGRGHGPRGFDLVITDLRMPGMSGIDALEYLRAGPWATTPVIAMTGFGDQATHDSALGLGALITLDKPFPPEQLLARVRSALC